VKPERFNRYREDFHSERSQKGRRSVAGVTRAKRVERRSRRELNPDGCIAVGLPASEVASGLLEVARKKGPRRRIARLEG
jgi:hypothetical protein